MEKSTLISLLIYHRVDTQYPEYFRYLSRTLEKLQKSTVTQDEFLKIFMNPDVDMGFADKNELADVKSTELRLFQFWTHQSRALST